MRWLWRAALVFMATCVLGNARQESAKRPAGRPLTIEDYYRIQTLANRQISPDGKWVAYTVSTRIEEDNNTRTETYLVPTDGSLRPQGVDHYGKDVSEAGWTDDSLLRYSAYRQRWSLDPSGASPAPVKIDRLPGGAVIGAT